MNIFRVLLETPRIDVNVKDDKSQAALHFAAINGNPEIVQTLLDKGIDINAQDDCKRTPLHWVIEMKN